MAKTIFEQMDGTYTMQGDYCLPDLTLPAEDERPIGVWAQRRLRYLKQHHKILYCNLLTSGKLRSHLADIEEEAQSLFLRLVKEYAELEGMTEQLKAENPTEWVQKMNNIRSRAAETVYADLILRNNRKSKKEISQVCFTESYLTNFNFVVYCI